MSLNIIEKLCLDALFTDVDDGLIMKFADVFQIQLYIRVIKLRQVGHTTLSPLWGFDSQNMNNTSDYIEQIKEHYKKTSGNLYKHWTKFQNLKCFA